MKLYDCVHKDHMHDCRNRRAVCFLKLATMAASPPLLTLLLLLFCLLLSVSGQQPCAVAESNLHLINGTAEYANGYNGRCFQRSSWCTVVST